MLTEAFQPRTIHIAQLLFGNKVYGVTDLTFRVDRPPWLENNDQVIEVILSTDEFSNDLVEWMARNDGQIPSVEINAFSGTTSHKIQNASPTQWGGRHVTLVGGEKYTLERSTLQVSLSAEDSKELLLKLAKENVRKMKINDPMLARFEIDLED